MDHYKYTSTHDWFEQWVGSLKADGNQAQLRHILMELAQKTDADTLQNLFEDAMDEDDFFKDLDAYADCWSCGVEYEIDGMTVTETPEGTVYHCEDCRENDTDNPQ